MNDHDDCPLCRMMRDDLPIRRAIAKHELKPDSLPKYVTVAGGPSLLIAMDHGNPTVPGGTYMPARLPSGHIRLEGISRQAIGKHFTINANVWPVALRDYRVMPV